MVYVCNVVCALHTMCVIFAGQIFDDKDKAIAALAEEEKTDSKENAKLHKRMKYTIENQEELLKHNTGGTKAENRGC